MSLARLILAIGFVMAPRVALACPVCFGDANAPMAVATNNGILFMLGVVVFVLTGFASFIIYLIRRASRAAASTESTDAGRYVRGQEGTA